MTNQARKTRRNVRSAQTILRWEFIRGSERMSCQVAQENADAFAVIALPYKRMQRATVEVCGSAIAALRRHAAIAADLRDMGWKLVAYTN